MDLGALVRRLVAGPTGAGGGASSAGSPAAGSPGRAGVPLAPAGNLLARPAWRDLPPIQRVVGDAPLVAPNAAFEAGLTTTSPAPLALAPLGHDRWIDAPAGLVTGIAAPVQRAPASPMPSSVRRSQREPHRAHAVQRSAGAALLPDAEEQPAMVVETPPGGSERDQHVSMPADALPAAALDRSTAVVAAPPPLVLMTSAPDQGSRPVGMVGPAAVASSAHGSSPARADGVATAAPMATAGPQVARLATDATTRAAGSAPAPPAPSVTSSLDPTRPTPAGERPVRRIRLGSPLTPTVARMAVQPAAHPMAPGASTPQPHASLDATPAATPAAAAREASSGAVAWPADRTDWSAGPSGAANAELAVVAGSPTPPSPAAAVRLQRTASPALSRAPLVGGLRPVLTAASPVVAVSRTSEPESASDARQPIPPSAMAGSPTAALAALGHVASTGAASLMPESVGMPSGGAFAGMTTAGSAFAVEPAASGGITPARLTWANPLADPGAAAPSPGSPASHVTTGMGERSGIVSSAAQPSVSRSASRTAGLRVGPALGGQQVRPSGSSRTSASSTGARPAGSSSVGPTAASSSSSPGSAPVVSRAVSIDEVEVTEQPGAGAAESSAAASASSTGAGSASGGSAAAGPASEAARDQETQVWADRLYDRIALRLRREMLVERERAGALVDRGF